MLRVEQHIQKKDAVVSNGVQTGGKTGSVTATGRQTVSDLARQSGADLSRKPSTPGVMCQQDYDWARGNTCFPQKLVQLVGYRDPDSRPSSPLRPKATTTPQRRPMSSSDTPIG